MVILFDGSSYITAEEFSRTQLFAKSVLAPFNISQDQTNVAAAVYAGEVVISFNFTLHYSLSAVSTAIDNISTLNQPLLNISAALKLINSSLLTSGRESIKDIFLVFVSEIFTDNFRAISQDLRDQGVIVIPIGVGSNFSVDQLEVLAAKPSVVLTTSFQHIDTVEGIIGGIIAQGKRILQSSSSSLSSSSSSSSS